MGYVAQGYRGLSCSFVVLLENEQVKEVIPFGYFCIMLAVVYHNVGDGVRYVSCWSIKIGYICRNSFRIYFLEVSEILLGDGFYAGWCCCQIYKN